MRSWSDRQTMCALEEGFGQKMAYRERQPTNPVILIQVNVSYIPIHPRLHYKTLSDMVRTGPFPSRGQDRQRRIVEW